MHGYQPGKVTLTTELLLAHKHPDDHPRVARVLDRLHDDTGQLTRNHGR
ncbi:hypothetical protein ACVH9Z_24890 [Rhodococcus opacus]|jgi:hypothetical protein|nr:hypothetical protein Rwratislav_14453 [Rhodococcus wratislaviensis IFP 2016]MBA8962977.1 hypothetical protein [Rhodococcus opacus]MBP2206467.1 hypothetical protein [Rhodococcus opacus]CAG7627162.1 hypothetical protein E143388_06929 [Rhodococcus opacus]